LVDWFMALCFMATSAPPAVRRIWILPMNQYAWWPITFGIKGIINFVDCLMALCFTASSAVHVWELFMICQQWAAIISSISHSFSITINEQCVLSWCYFSMTPTWNMDLLEGVSKNFDVNFVMKEFPADKQFTIWWTNSINTIPNSQETKT
jgi:hypothetical protein